MFDRLFNFITEGVCNAVLRGFQKADQKLVGHIENDQPLLIEVEAEPEPKTNGKTTTRRKAASRS